MASRHAALEKETAAEFAATDAKFAETRDLFASTRQLINRLPHITEAPGQRLDRLEGQ